MIKTDNNLAKVPLILIVDDNPKNLQVLGKLLDEEKYEIEFAVNGEAALDWLNNKQFDMILLDINMPGMNGFEVCKRIRSEPRMNKVPVIFLSAESERKSILKGFEMGAQDYVTKPFDSRELIVRVKTHLTLKDSLEKLEKLNQSLEEKVQERTQQLKEAYLKLETANLKLVDLDKAKSEFLHLISHEIRTPLNGIMGPMELLKDHAGNNEFRELIEVLDFSVNRLEKFSMNALLITQLRTKQYDISKSKIHPGNLINEVINDFNDRINSKNLQLIINDEADQRFIIGEADLVKKCIYNILDNAVKFSPPNGIIEIHTHIGEQYIICEIKDRGQGFSTELTGHAFELFIQDKGFIDNSAGFGLPIVKMIMDAHGGKITAGNNPDGGAVVKLLFKNEG